jgi:flavin-dependent dehydrogenase
LKRADVAIVGAGSSGAAAAAFLAERGLRVVVLERRALDEAGARWVNGVPRAAFVEAGVELPGPGETFGAPVALHLIAPGGRQVVAEHDLLDVDMRSLVARLQARAARAGAELVGGVSVRGRDGDVLRTSKDDVRATWIVDASGLAGARLLDQPATARDRVCAAAQEVRRVVDEKSARAFFEEQGVPVGEICCRVAVAGGFSVLNVRLHPGVGTVGILTGSIPALGFPSGRAMLDDFVKAQPWIGERIFGGAAPIPLGRAHARLAEGNVALLGDAGRQVFPAHGSGVGAGMLAARMLADTIASGAPLRDYEVAWQRRYGGVFAFFESLRLWNQRTDPETIGRLLGSGVLDRDSLRAGIDQVMPRPGVRAVAGKLRALAREPALARDLVGTVARSAALRALYARYPRRAEAVARWARRVDALLTA